MTGVDIRGLTEAVDTIEGIRQGTQAAEGIIGAGSTLPYAFGIETGRHRGGTLARRAGGVFYLRNALRVQQLKIPGRIAKALFGGRWAVRKEQQSIAEDIQATARSLVVVASGALRASIEAFWPGSPPPGMFRWTRQGRATNAATRRQSTIGRMGGAGTRGRRYSSARGRR